MTYEFHCSKCGAQNEIEQERTRMTPFFRQFMENAHRQYADAFVMNRHRHAKWRVHPTDWQQVADDVRPYSAPADLSGNYLFGLPVELDDSVMEGPWLIAILDEVSGRG